MIINLCEFNVDRLVFANFTTIICAILVLVYDLRGGIVGVAVMEGEVVRVLWRTTSMDQRQGRVVFSIICCAWICRQVCLCKYESILRIILLVYIRVIELLYTRSMKEKFINFKISTYFTKYIYEYTQYNIYYTSLYIYIIYVTHIILQNARFSTITLSLRTCTLLICFPIIQLLQFVHFCNSFNNFCAISF